MRPTLILGIVLVLVVSFASPAIGQDDEPTYWPTSGWRTSTPEAQGLDSEQLAGYWEHLRVGEPGAMGTAFIAYVPGTSTFIHSALVIRHGTVVMDAATYPFSNDQPHELFSATKSVIGLLIGIAIDQGAIQSPDQSLWDFFPKADAANMDAEKEAITVRHLLNNTSGLSIGVPFSRGVWNTDGKPYIQFVLDSKMTNAPGTTYLYQTGNSDLLSAILQEATGMTTLAFAEQYLFGPLGITDAMWASDPEGVNWGGWKLALSGYDLAKIGYLMLHEGRWEDQQLVSAAWVKATIQDQIEPLQPHFWEGYSNQWYNGPVGYWSIEPEIAALPYRGFAAFGRGMQILMVIPDLDLVLVTLGDLQVELPFTGLAGYIVPSVQSDEALPDNPTAFSHLQAVIAANPPPTATSLPTIAQEMSGTPYTLAENLLGWESLTFTFGANEASLAVTIGDRVVTLPIGLDGAYRMSTDTLPIHPLFWWHEGETIASRGTWQDEATFLFELWDSTGSAGFVITLRMDSLMLRAVPVLTQEFRMNIQLTPS